MSEGPTILNMKTFHLQIIQNLPYNGTEIVNSLKYLRNSFIFFERKIQFSEKNLVLFQIGKDGKLVVKMRINWCYFLKMSFLP